MPISHTAIIFAIVFTSVQNASTNSGARAVHQRCSAPKVRAGETAVMTFFIRQDINASSDINFVTMTRASAQDHDILICDRKSPLVCKPTSNLYQTDSSIDRNRITLRIPKVTRAFEDRYVLKIYVNGQAEPTDFCYLHVQEEWTCPRGTWMCRNGTCISVHWRCDTRNDCGDNSDEQHCGEWVCPVGQWKCRDNVCISSIQRCNNRNDCSDGSDEENCDVNGANTDADCYKAEPGVDWKTATITLVGLLASFIVVAVIVAAVYVHNKRTTRNKADNADGAEGDPMLVAHIDAHTQSPRAGKPTNTEQLSSSQGKSPEKTRAGQPTNTEQLSSSQGKSPEKTRSSVAEGEGERSRYYFENVQKGDEEQLLKSQRNGPGTFLIRPNKRGGFVLAVNFDGKIECFVIVKHAHGYTFVCFQYFFPTLDKLVDYHTTHAIRDVQHVYGTLVKPCVQIE